MINQKIGVAVTRTRFSTATETRADPAQQATNLKQMF